MLLVASFARANDPATTQPNGKLKIGVLVSQYTATGPYLGGGKPYGYDHTKIADDLRDDTIQLIPIIEPGSETDTELADAIKERFPDSEGQVYLVNDGAALKSMSAIVLARVPNIKEDALAGIHAAASEGTPLLIVGRAGNVNPGYKEQKVRDLVGMSEAEYAWAPRPQPAEVLDAAHPLIKDLLTEGQQFNVQPAGALGKLVDGSKPLIKLNPQELRRPDAVEQNDIDFYPLYTTNLGKGKVVVCNWTTAPSVLKTEKFYVRCLHYLTMSEKK